MNNNLKKILGTTVLALSISVCSTTNASAQANQMIDARKVKSIQTQEKQEEQDIKLVGLDFGKDVPFQKLIQNQNRDIKAFETTPLTQQQISNIVMSANSKIPNGYTVAPINGISIVDVYLVTPNGIVYWNPENEELLKLSSEDNRKQLGDQQANITAPLSLVFVVNFDKYYKAVGNDKISMEQLRVWGGIEAGQMMQNINLACANMELASVISSSNLNEELRKLLRIDGKFALLAVQSVGIATVKK